MCTGTLASHRQEARRGRPLVASPLPISASSCGRGEALGAGGTRREGIRRPARPLPAPAPSRREEGIDDDDEDDDEDE